MAAPEILRIAAMLGSLAFAWVHVGCVGCGGDDDDDTRDPGDGTVQPGDEILEIQVRPESLVLDRVTTFELLCVGRTDDGYFAQLDDCAFEVVTGDAADVDLEGRVMPHEPGSIELVVRRDSLQSQRATIEVIEIGTADVRVIDAWTGEPLGGALVSGPEQLAMALTDGEGRAHLEGDFQGPLDLVIRTAGYRDTLLQSVRARNVLAAVRSYDKVTPKGWAVGEAEFPREPFVGEMGLAIALAATPVGPAWTSIQDFMPYERNVSEWGLDVELPYNLVIQNVVTEFWAPVYEGTTALSVAGGYFEVGEALAIAAQVEEHGAGIVFNMVGTYADRLILGMHGPFDVPVDAPDGEDEVHGIVVPLDMEVDREVSVTLLSPPVDFFSYDPPTVFGYRELVDDLGWAIAGIGVGTKPFSHPDADPPDDDDDSGGDDDDATGAQSGRSGRDEPWEVVPLLEAAAGHELGTPYTIYGAMTTYEGLDTGQAAGTMSYSPPMTGTDVVLPAFLALYELVATDEPFGHFAYDGDTEAVDAVRAAIFYLTVSGDGFYWKKIDVYGPGGPGEFTLSDAVLAFEPATSSDTSTSNAWTVDAVGLRATDYQAMLADDGHDGLESFQQLTQTRSTVKEGWQVSE